MSMQNKSARKLGTGEILTVSGTKQSDHNSLTVSHAVSDQPSCYGRYKSAYTAVGLIVKLFCYGSLRGSGMPSGQTGPAMNFQTFSLTRVTEARELVKVIGSSGNS
jgi:hypothetical protein